LARLVSFYSSCDQKPDKAAEVFRLTPHNITVNHILQDLIALNPFMLKKSSSADGIILCLVEE
jgi:hypothetical protein